MKGTKKRADELDEGENVGIGNRIKKCLNEEGKSSQPMYIATCNR